MKQTWRRRISVAPLRRPIKKRLPEENRIECALTISACGERAMLCAYRDFGTTRMPTGPSAPIAEIS